MPSSPSSLPYSILSLLLLLLLLLPPTTAQTSPKPFHPRALLLPITKDPTTNQYTTTIFQRTPLRPVRLTLDIGGKSLWVACDPSEYTSSTYRPALCRSPQCKLAKSKSCGDCWAGPIPGCNNNTCSSVVYNTVHQSAQIGELATDVIVLRSTNGSRPGPIVMARNFLFSCGSLLLAEKLPKSIKGIAGFGRSSTSLPSLLSTSFKIENKFAICLPSSPSKTPGVAFVGNGPYTMQPGVSISARLSYTPLLVNPVTTVKPTLDHFPDKSWPSMEYFIAVESIRIQNQTLPLNPSLLKFNKKGTGGTKISTVVPYTILQTSIYDTITKAFVKAISGVRRVEAVAPFGACYDASGLGSTRLGPGVPAIEIGLRNNVTWTIFGGNSMVYVKKGAVACLALVDGGKKARSAIVIGGHQLEDNFVEFDVGRSRVGFSSTLLGKRTTCGNFDFGKSA